MEQHPVPQNIIDVEFKLFGSFTLKQFGKMLIGSVIGVILYFTPLIPPLIKYPAIFIVVSIGILLAIIPNFGIWLNGFFRALLISPRYVWVKEKNTPEILLSKEKREVTKSQNVASARTQKKIDIDSIPLGKMYGTVSATEAPDQIEDGFIGDDSSKLRTDNFSKLYDQVFTNDLDKVGKPAVEAESKTVVTPDIEVKSVMSEHTNADDLIDSYSGQITDLKYQLSMLNKDQSYAEKEQEILSKINDIYQEVKLLRAEAPVQKGGVRVESQKNVVSLEVLDEGFVIYGIVVDKKDKPIDSVKVIFANVPKKEQYSTISSGDGRFITKGFLPKGEYTVSLDKSGMRFHSYKIVVADQKLPAYKFREK